MSKSIPLDNKLWLICMLHTQLRMFPHIILNFKKVKKKKNK